MNQTQTQAFSSLDNSKVQFPHHEFIWCRSSSIRFDQTVFNPLFPKEHPGFRIFNVHLDLHP